MVQVAGDAPMTKHQIAEIARAMALYRQARELHQAGEVDRAAACRAEADAIMQSLDDGLEAEAA